MDTDIQINETSRAQVLSIWFIENPCGDFGISHVSLCSFVTWKAYNIKFVEPKLARIAQSVERRALGSEVLGSLPAVPEVTLGGHSSSSLTIPGCKIETRPWP